ncbi:MAG: M50 family metallopeptidase, partial [Crocinitomicaceae bacterium]|nr:M50 family metallopeptidase [Crocinitomicaceae bacterium]
FALTFSILINDYILIGLLLFVLLIHELGHFIMMKLFGYEELNMTFIPFLGAMVQGKKNEYSQKETIIMLMAGPLPGIIFGLLLINYSINNEIAWLVQLSVLLLFLNIVNLLPLDPLDGGQLVKNLFLGNHELFQLVFAIISSIMVIIIGWWFNSWFIMIFGFLMGFRVKQLHKLFLIRKDLKNENISVESSYESLSDRSYAKIKKIVMEYTPVLKTIQDESDHEHFDKIVANQVDNILLPPSVKDASLTFKLMTLLIWIGAFIMTAYVFLNIDFQQLIYAFQN